MIELSGLDPDRDIDVEIVGRRPGEKLNEALFNSYERPRATIAEKILLAQREPLALEQVESMFKEIVLLVLEGDAAGLAAKVCELTAERQDPGADADDRRRTPAPAGADVSGDEVSGPARARTPAPGANGSPVPPDRHDAPAPLVHSPNS
jgi:hypothetical protein